MAIKKKIENVQTIKRWFFLKGFRKYVLLLILIAVCQMEAVSVPGTPKWDENRPLCLIIMDFDDFFCFSCQDSFLRFIRYVPAQIRRESFWGILAYESQKTGTERALAKQIIEKKLRGFKKANHIDFPILIDHGSNFIPLSKEGSGLFLFSRKTRVLEHYIFPLSQNQMDEVLTMLSPQL